MAKEFFRPRPAQRRGGFKLVVDTLYRNAAGEVSSGFTFDRDVLEAFVRRVYEKDFHPMTDIEFQMFRAVWDTLDIATEKGFGKRPADDPDHDFYEELKRNNAVFAAFKVHRMQNDIAALLLDSNGVLKPFERWAKEVMPIADHQIYQWLETEYDTAIIRAHQAADWRQFEREKDVLPNLKWMPSTSLHPGADHRRFWGTIRPIDDPFWNNHRPGDRWNCKCSLSSTDEEPTPLPDFDPADKPQDGLENNPGKDARLFSDKHPYVVNAHPGAGEAVEKLMEEIEDKERMRRQRAEIKEQARFLTSRTLHNNDFGKDIVVSMASIKEWLNQPHKWITEKNALLPVIENVIAESNYIGYGPDKHDPDITMHLFEITIHGEKSWVIVRELIDGSVKLHSVSDSDNILKYLSNKKG